jgi:hypothetical protein
MKEDADRVKKEAIKEKAMAEALKERALKEKADAEAKAKQIEDQSKLDLE